MALNKKERAFATEYIIRRGNAYQAALKAGYARATASHAYEWLTDTQTHPEEKRHLPYKPHLAAYIEAEIAKMDAEKVADAQEVMEYLTSVMRGQSKASVLCLVGDGAQDVIEKPPDEKERLKAAESLAKIHGLMTNKLDLQGTLPVVIDGESDLED